MRASESESEKVCTCIHYKLCTLTLYMRTRLHARTHARTNTHTHTYTITSLSLSHTLSLSLSLFLSLSLSLSQPRHGAESKNSSTVLGTHSERVCAPLHLLHKVIVLIIFQDTFDDTSKYVLECVPICVLVRVLTCVSIEASIVS